MNNNSIDSHYGVNQVTLENMCGLFCYCVIVYRWMSTIEFLTNWRKSYEAKGEKEGESEEQTAL